MTRTGLALAVTVVACLVSAQGAVALDATSLTSQLPALPGAPSLSGGLPTLPPGAVPTASQQANTHGPDPVTPQTILGAIETPRPLGGATGTPLQIHPGARVRAADVRASEPSRWCGADRTTDDTADALANGTARYHAIYAIPSDGIDRLGLVASDLQTDAFQASELLEDSYGRAIRFDMGTRCGPQYLDITTLRMSQSTVQLQALATTSHGTFDAIRDDLQAAGFQTEGQDAIYTPFSYLVWLDAPAPANACGESTYYVDPNRVWYNQSQAGGKVASVFRSGTGFCGSNAVRHEIGHTLGAVQYGAPNFTAGHCFDAAEDTMCVAGPQRTASGDPIFDYGNNDYFALPNRPLAWWTTDLNRYLCPGLACNLPNGVAIESQANAAIASAASRPRLRLITRHKGRYFSYKLRLSGKGRVTALMWCTRANRTRPVLVRALRLPRTLSGRARCDTRPKAALTLLGP
jgi:hypothetical protein